MEINSIAAQMLTLAQVGLSRPVEWLMSWFRHHHRSLLRFTLGIWGLAVVVAAFQGCLVLPEHSLTTPHEASSTLQQEDDHALHASGCLQHCESAAKAISATAQLPTVDLASLAILLLLPVLMLFNPAAKITFAALALRRPAPLGPPARLIFVRFND